MKSHVLAGAVALGILLVTDLSRAADISKSQCVDANTYGQTLRREGKLSAARGQFQTCNDPKCPEIVRTDCTQRMDEIEQVAPTIVFDVKNAAGEDVSAVKVMVDGEVVAEKLDGTALRVDPGSHEFKFEVAGEKAVIRTFVLKEGEKVRRERILVVGDTPPPLPTPAPVAQKPATPAPDAEEGASWQKIGGIAAGGAGVVLIGLGSVFGLVASSRFSDQKKNCESATVCVNRPQATSDHDAVTKFGGYSTVSFVAGAVLLVGGAVLYFTAPTSRSASALRRLPALASGALVGLDF